MDIGIKLSAAVQNISSFEGVFQSESGICPPGDWNSISKRSNEEVPMFRRFKFIQEKMMRIGIFCFVILLFSTGSSLVHAQSWPQYRGPQATGKISNANVDLANKQLEIHWKVAAPSGFSSFAVQDNVAVTLVGRDEQEVCLALDAKTGKELWATGLGPIDYRGGGNAGAQGNKGGDGPRSTPAISAGQVFVYDAHSNLLCLRVSDGQPIWKHDIKKEFQGTSIKWKNASSPLIDETNVYVAGGGQGNSLLAFEKSTGVLK